MFRRKLAHSEGLLLAEQFSGRLSASIHMLFMAFPIAVIWMDHEFVVVDKVVANPWRPMYIPRYAAQYTLEALPHLVEVVELGARLRFHA